MSYGKIGISRKKLGHIWQIAQQHLVVTAEISGRVN